MATTRRTHMRRTLACVAAAACCVVGGVSPAYGAGDPIPVPRVTPTPVPSSPLLPGREISIRAKVSQDLDSVSGEETYLTNLTVTFLADGRRADLTEQDCSDLVATFWSGRSNNYYVKAEYLSNSCIITADYAREARHAFYSLDESGHVQVRAPLVYLNQIASSLDNASVTELEVRFTSIDNARCNAAPSLEHLDDLISSDPNAPSHLSYCQWKTKEGATIPCSKARSSRPFSIIEKERSARSLTCPPPSTPSPSPPHRPTSPPRTPARTPLPSQRLPLRAAC